MSKVALMPPLEVMGPSMQNVPELEVSYVVADLKSLEAWIVDQINILYQHGLEPDFVLMGAEEFHQATGTMCQYTPYSFKGPPIFRGLPFRVSPTITGMCVVPKAR